MRINVAVVLVLAGCAPCVVAETPPPTCAESFARAADGGTLPVEGEPCAVAGDLVQPSVTYTCVAVTPGDTAHAGVWAAARRFDASSVVVAVPRWGASGSVAVVLRRCERDSECSRAMACRGMEPADQTVPIVHACAPRDCTL